MNTIVATDKELRVLIRDEMMSVLKDLGLTKEEKIVKGLQELSNALRISLSTAKRWKKIGKFDGCYRGDGRTIYFNVDKINNKLTEDNG